MSLYPTDFGYYLQDISDADLAELYYQYIERRNTAWFSDICEESQRRGLTLDELEEIHQQQFDPPCSLDS